MLVTAFLKGHHHHDVPVQTTASSADSTRKQVTAPKEDVPEVSPCNCCSDDPVGDLDVLKGMAEELETGNAGGVEEQKSDEGEVAESDQESGKALTLEQQRENAEDCSSFEDERADKIADEDKSHDSKKILAMSINTAIAIALHNFPEGLATFVATLNDPRVGLVLGVAIAIHNIPEGLCVALPIYYATGNRWKAFVLALLSGLSEPLAALFGWAILSGSFSEITFAVLFGIVAGMMTIISVRELLPTAHRYDPEDKVVTYCFMAGMAVMALSLVLFTL